LLGMKPRWLTPHIFSWNGWQTLLPSKYQQLILHASL
jgi:hypothetical protein